MARCATATIRPCTAGLWLALRTIGSTMVGLGLDSAVFITIAFAAVLSGDELFWLTVTQWPVKVAYEMLATLGTYAAMTFLKRTEGLDVYDEKTSFNPISLR